MAQIRQVMKSDRATYSAFLTTRNGQPVEGTDLHFGQHVEFRGKGWTVSGSDGKAPDATVRLVNESISREVLEVARTELTRLG